MDKIPVYCQFEFLDEFYKSIPPFDIENPDLIKNFSDFFKMIFSDCELLMDIPVKQVDSLYRDNLLLKTLVKRSTAGGSAISHQPDFFKELPKNKLIVYRVNPRSVFLLDSEADESENLKNGFGFHFIGRQKADKAVPHFFKINQHSISRNPKKKTERNWSFLKNRLAPANAAIISDRYCLIEDGAVIKENMFSLLRNILPVSLADMDFHLAIFTTYLKKGATKKDKPEPGLAQLQPLHQALADFIQTLHLPYSVECSIVVSNEVKHDRELVTNYYRLNSGSTFNYFKGGKPLTETTLSVFPFGFRVDEARTCYNEVSRILEECSNILRNVKNSPDEKKGLAGSGINRLLEVSP